MNGHAEQPHDHILPPGMYYGIFGILMVLTVLTVSAAFVDLGFLNIIVALTVAIIKAALVIMFFMHVKYGARLNWVVIGSGVFWLLILLGMLMLDYGSRGWMAAPHGGLGEIRHGSAESSEAFSRLTLFQVHG